MLQHKSKSKKYYFFIVLAVFILSVLNKGNFSFISASSRTATTSQVTNREGDNISVVNKVYFLPTSTTKQIVTHSTYYLSYSEKHEQAEWVAYELKPEHLSGGKHKRPYFVQDP